MINLNMNKIVWCVDMDTNVVRDCIDSDIIKNGDIRIAIYTSIEEGVNVVFITKGQNKKYFIYDDTDIDNRKIMEIVKIYKGKSFISYINGIMETCSNDFIDELLKKMIFRILRGEIDKSYLSQKIDIDEYIDNNTLMRVKK